MLRLLGFDALKFVRIGCIFHFPSQGGAYVTYSKRALWRGEPNLAEVLRPDPVELRQT